MNETTTTYDDGIADNKLQFLDVLIALAKHKKLIVCLPLGAAALAAAICMVMPEVYKANAKILPPQQAQTGAAALLSQLGGVAAAAGGGGGAIKNPNDLYIGMLKSRTVADKLIARFNLTKAYDTTSLEKARRELAENTTVASGKDGLILLEVEDEDQKRVAELTNGYIDELLKLTKVLAVTEASQRRLFLERQLEQSKDNLAAAEMALKESLDVNGVISVDSDSQAIVETVGRLRAQIAAKEIQLGSMRAFVTPNNQDYKRAQEELNSLRAEFSRLQNGRPTTESAAPKGRNQQAGLQNMKILREVKYHQMLYELLAKQYEFARLDEAKDSSIIQVLDGAVEPERKFKPKTTIIVALATLMALLVAMAWAYVSEMKEAALRIPQRAAQWTTFKSYLKRK